MANLTKSQFDTLYNSAGSGTFLDNSTQAIVEASMRAFAKDIEDSFFNLNDNKYSGAAGVSLNITDTTGLKAITTVGITVGFIIFYRDSSGNLNSYKLLSGTDPESLPSVVRPTDYDGSTNQKVWKIAATTSTGSNDSDLTNYISSDFVWNTISQGFASSLSGAGSTIGNDTYGVDNISHAIGVWSLQTGTSTTGRSGFQNGAGNIKLGIGTALTIRARVAVQVLSDGTDTYTVYFGLGAIGGEPADGVYFKYSSAVNSGKWLAVTANSSTYTSTDTGVTATTSYMIFEMTINDTGTSVTFKINGSTVATTTTNIPSGFLSGLFFNIEKSAGTTNRKLSLDWYEFLMTRSTSR